MAAAAAMDFPHDRRLSISKPSSARIAKRTASSAAPSRPIPRIVKADPSTFRRVVQELTGSTTPSPPQPRPPPSAPPRSSRLQRIAPPPLPPHVRASFQHARASDRHLLLLQETQQHHRLQQQQQQQQLMAMTRPHLSPINPLHAPLLRASTALSSSPLLPGQFPHPFIHPLPMLSPRLFSPLPSLTPGDNAWACPLDVLPPVPAPIPYPLPLPPPGRNGDGAFIGVSERLERGPLPPPISPLQMPISPASRFPWPSPWSPYFPVSPAPPIYPGYFPPSPGFGISNLYSGSAASNGAVDFNSPHDFTFQSPSDYGFSKPS